MIKEIMTSNKKEIEIDYNEILKKQAIKKEFLLSIKSSVLNGNKINYLDKLFNSINAILFAGFDYYYVDDVKSMLKEDSRDIKQNFDILINEEHIDKLRSTIECFPTLEFVDLKNDSYIWYRNSNVYCSLTPFERKENEILIKENGKKINQVKVKSIRQNYGSIGYKLIK